MKRLLTALKEIQPKDDRSGWERSDYMREYQRLWVASFFLTENWSIALANGVMLLSWIPVLVGLNLLVRFDLLPRGSRLNIQSLWQISYAKERRRRVEY